MSASFEDSVTLMDNLFRKLINYLIPLTSTRRGPRLRLRTSSQATFESAPELQNATTQMLSHLGRRFVLRGRFELPTPGSSDQCSNQLSYLSKRVSKWKFTYICLASDAQVMRSIREQTIEDKLAILFNF